MLRSFPPLATAILLFAVAFALSPLFSSGFAGFEQGQFPVETDFWPIQPAGWAFSIWGVIYAWLIAGAAFGVFKAPDDPDWSAMRPPLLISLMIGTFWIAAANASPILATVMIVVMAATAILAMLRAGSNSPYWQVRPVALYAGWLTAASGVGIGVVLGGYGVLSAQSAALLMLLAVLAVALVAQSRRPQEWGYPLAIVWALVGIIAANAASGTWPVIALAIIGVLCLVAQFVLRGRTPAH